MRLILLGFVVRTLFESAIASSLFKLQIESLKQDLEKQEWSRQEEKCLSATLNLLKNVQNHTLWASRVWDSIQFPTGVLYGSKFQLGNFDECIEASWSEEHPELRAQYCLTELQLSDNPTKVITPDPYTSVKEYIDSHNIVSFNTLAWGLCVPIQCQTKSVEKIAKVYLKNSFLGFAEAQTNVSVILCQEDTITTYTTGSIAFMIFLTLLISLTLIISVYYYIYKDNHFMGKEIMKCFSVMENIAQLLQSQSGDVKFLHGLRFFIIAFIIACHVYLISCLPGYSNTLYMEKSIEKFKIHWFFYNGSIVVDMLITVSGFLMMKSLLAREKSFSPIKFIIRRYLRFMPSVIFAIMVIIYLTDHMYSGPLKHLVINEVESCRKNWWLNILTMNNYIDNYNMCYPPLWTVALDIHLTIFCTLLFWIYKRHPNMAKLIFIVALAASVILPSVETYRLELLAVLDFRIESIRNFRQQILAMPTYMYSHLRAGPFLIGFGFAYIIANFKPTQRVKIESKVISIIGFLLSIITFVALLTYGGTLLLKDYNPIESAIFAGLNRNICAVAVCILIAVCEYGSLPFIPAFLSCSFFTVLSEMSLVIFLIHFAIVSRTILTTRNTMQMDWTVLIFNTVQTYFVTIFFSFFGWLFYNKPVNNILDLMFKSWPKRVDKEKRNTNLESCKEKSL